MHPLMILLAETEAKAPIMMPTWVFPLIAFCGFLFAGFVVWSFRDVANRHADRLAREEAAGHGADDHDATGHGASGGAH